ncbi:hypothetical protein, partial [Streptomyces rubiginosohelvolus]
RRIRANRATPSPRRILSYVAETCLKTKGGASTTSWSAATTTGRPSTLRGVNVSSLRRWTESGEAITSAWSQTSPCPPTSQVSSSCHTEGIRCPL